MPVIRTLPATLVMPSLSGGKDYRFKATGSDIGEDITLPDGTVERRNCTTKSVCHHKQINEGAILLKAKADSRKFVLASPEVAEVRSSEPPGTHRRLREQPVRKLQ